jgi:hypothetical protein
LILLGQRLLILWRCWPSDFPALPLEPDRLLDLLCGQLGLTLQAHDSLHIFKIRRKKFTLSGAFPKERCGKLGATISGVDLSLSCRVAMWDVSHVSVETIKKYPG